MRPLESYAQATFESLSGDVAVTFCVFPFCGSPFADR